ncbi:hypothetical protein IWX75_003461 [Arthrobacter sp. CAN_A6]
MAVELCQSSHISSVENRVQYLRESGHGPRVTIIRVSYLAPAGDDSG